EDGDLAGTFNTLLDSDLSVYVKAVEAWGWDPTYAVVTNVAEVPRPGGLLDLTVTFERTDE
ncbi:MAG TPA: hypothetical protein VMW94_02515, partial [Actinomycetes bacterium]|nr:hypothetical protein [Actinomycetes bacterium]